MGIALDGHWIHLVIGHYGLGEGSRYISEGVLYTSFRAAIIIQNEMPDLQVQLHFEDTEMDWYLLKPLREKIYRERNNHEERDYCDGWVIPSKTLYENKNILQFT